MRFISSPSIPSERQSSKLTIMLRNAGVALSIVACVCLIPGTKSFGDEKTNKPKENKKGGQKKGGKKKEEVEKLAPIEFLFDQSGNKVILNSNKNKKGETTFIFEVHAKGVENIRSSGSIVFSGADIDMTESKITGFTSTSNEFCRVQGNTLSFLSMGLKSDVQRRGMEMRRATIKFKDLTSPKLTVTIDSSKGKFSGKYLITDSGLTEDKAPAKKRR
jgi:hypothetical protein